LNHSNKTINKYLSSYAEPEIKNFNVQLPLAFESVLVIPVFDEPIDNLNHFLELPSSKSVLIIWVFNCPDNVKRDEQNRTQFVMDYFIQQLNAQKLENCRGTYFSQVNNKLGVYLLNRCSSGQTIPEKQGVGLARKLGMDFGLKLIDLQNQNLVKQVRLIHSSDADVRLPYGYFDVPDLEENTSAVIYPFEHKAVKGFNQSMALYEFSLRYYVERLDWVGSPYAFHTIGSLIAVTPLAYAQVRGMPKRSGAEDFYLLNKLAKVGSVISLQGPVIEIAGRPSHRVPFGTGPALIKLQQMEDPFAEYTFYHPEIFHALKQVLNTVSSHGQSIASVELLFRQLSDRMSSDMATSVITVLRLLKIEKQFEHLSQKKNRTQFIDGFNTWFDAFVTLRFIHLMRDLAYPNITLEALKKYFENEGVSLEYYPRITALGI